MGVLGYYIGRWVFETFLRLVFKMEVLLGGDPKKIKGWQLLKSNKDNNQGK